MSNDLSSMPVIDVDSHWTEPRWRRAKIGEDNLMFETDFPHATWVYQLPLPH